MTGEPTDSEAAAAYAEAERRIDEAFRTGRVELNLGELGLTKIPDSLGDLTGLVILDLSDNQLTNIPASIGNLTALTILYLNDNQLTDVPATVGDLTALATLYLQNNQLTRIPGFIGNLTALVNLDISNNQLTDIPDTIGNLGNLVALDLRGNQLRCIPDTIGNLTVLTSFYLNFNQLTGIPDSIGNLTALTSLYLNNNQLTGIPDTIGNLTALVCLSLYRNRLTEVPESIGNLTRLFMLYLDINRLTSIPETIRNLTAIGTLGLRENQLADLPLPLPHAVVQALELDNNPLPPEVMAAYLGGKDELGHLIDLLRNEGTVIREAKLVLAGEGNAGKSSLLAAMRGEPWLDGRVTTHGVEVKPVSVGVSGAMITLNGWDFGGQPEYRPTHQLFFTAPALYLVVWNPRLGSDLCKVDEWIDLIRYRAGDDVRVHVVATYADTELRGAWIDEAALRRRFGDLIVDFHHVDSRTGRGIDELKAALAATAHDLPHTTRRYPTSWLWMRNEIAATDVTYMSYADYEALAVRNGLSAVSARSLAINCNALGHWIYYADDTQLTSMVIFKADWLSTAISLVLDDAETRHGNGLLAHSRAAEIWPITDSRTAQGYPAELHPILLYLMDKFEISYRIAGTPADEPTSLVAQLVTSTQPDLTEAWDEYEPGLSQQTQVCEIVDRDGTQVTPTGLMYQLIVRLHRYSLGRYQHAASRHWQTGLVIDNDNNGRALIILDRHQLRISVKAAYPQYLLHRLVETVREHVSDFWPALTVRVMVPCGSTCGRNQPGSGLFALDTLIATKRRPYPESPCPSCLSFQNIDALLTGVTVIAQTSEDRIASAVDALLSARFTAVTATITAESREVFDAVNLRAQENLTAFQSLAIDTRKALTEAESGLRELLIALDDDSRDGPRAFTIELLDADVWHPGWTQRRIRVTLWCEHSHLPVRSLTPGKPAAGVYTIEVARKWLVQAGPLLKAMSIALRAVIPVAVGIIELQVPDTDRWRDSLTSQLQLAENSLDAITDLADDLPDEQGVPVPQPIGRRGPARLDSGLIRALQQHVAAEDPGFAGLIRVRDGSAHKWIHPQFRSSYEPVAPQIEAPHLGV